jgi:hypothetical protein
MRKTRPSVLVPQKDRPADSQTRLLTSPACRYHHSAPSSSPPAAAASAASAALSARSMVMERSEMQYSGRLEFESL